MALNPLEIQLKTSNDKAKPFILLVKVDSIPPLFFVLLVIEENNFFDILNIPEKALLPAFPIAENPELTALNAFRANVRMFSNLLGMSSRVVP